MAAVLSKNQSAGPPGLSVVANHAVVMLQLALGAEGEGPTRYVFDEGHHLFDAADSAFSAHLTGGETAGLRRWILGAEDRRASRARGLKARMEDILNDDESSREYLDDILVQARSLPNHGWLQRLSDGMPHGQRNNFSTSSASKFMPGIPIRKRLLVWRRRLRRRCQKTLAHASALTDSLGAPPSTSSESCGSSLSAFGGRGRRTRNVDPSAY